MRSGRLPRLALATALAAQVTAVALHLALPGQPLVDLDREHNLPTWLHSTLLVIAALLALAVLRREVAWLRRAGRSAGWAMTWLGVAGLFGYLAVDESLVIHEGFLTSDVRAWLGPESPLQLTLTWLLVFLPGIVGAVAFLLGSLGARAALSRPLVGWGVAGLACWVAALTLEGTAKAIFIPRGLYGLEVVLEETAETLGTTLLAVALWRYRTALAGWRPDGPAPRFAVPWRLVAGGTATLGVAAVVVAVAIVLNPHVLHKYVGDGYLRAGRLAEAAGAYRVAVAHAPGYATAWDRLGIAELRRGDHAGALAAFAAAEGADPRAAGPVAHRGVTLYRLGRDREAAEAFWRAAALEPDDGEHHRNLGAVLRRLGRTTEAEAAFRRAAALGATVVAVTELRVALPVDLPLAYIVDARVAAALGHTRRGRLGAAVAAYRAAVAAAPDLAAAHLGLGNELLRAAVARRVTRERGPIGVRGDEVELEPTQPSALFTLWLGGPGGPWTETESAVAPEALAALGADTATEAATHFRRAASLGAAGPAHLGLALLAGERGERDAAVQHLAAARFADPALPALRAADRLLAAAR